jgi:WhiB family redox-sensing transcriptional regulator
MTISLHLIRRPEWMARAACRGIDPDLFTGDRKNLEDLGKRVCATCPVRQECLAWAVAHDEVGVWGNTTHEERRQNHGASKRRNVSNFCRSGHFRTRESTYIRADGARMCRICEQERRPVKNQHQREQRALCWGATCRDGAA